MAIVSAPCPFAVPLSVAELDVIAVAEPVVTVRGAVVAYIRRGS